MLIETLDALARLDYPDYEVIVVDNNTQDEAVWRPVEQHCARLGARFRFFHVDPLPGFKAGALNFALAHCAPDAQIVAVIDSDYQVEPALAARSRARLRRAEGRDRAGAAGLSRRRRERVQGDVLRRVPRLLPDRHDHAQRAQRDHPARHDDAGAARRRWNRSAAGREWCITEDAELGLRLFEHGYEAQYLPRSYGRGLMPETFTDYKKQRFRWAYGAVQILRAHARALFSHADERLTRGQRYHFVAGWLPWLADGLNLLFTIAALGWSFAMIVAPHRIDPPLIMFSALPLALFTFKLVKLAHLYAARVGANIRQTLAAALAGLALSHTIGVAVVKALFTRNQPFFRTPKSKQPHALAEGIAAARTESLMLIAMLLAALGLTRQIALGPHWIVGIPEELKGPDVSVWVAVLLIQAVPYAAAVLVSLVSALSLPARWLGPLPTHVPAASRAAGAVTSCRRSKTGGARSARCSMKRWSCRSPRANPGSTDLERRAPELAAHVRSCLLQVAELSQRTVPRRLDPSPLCRSVSKDRAFGAYTLDRTLGFGGMGTVWLAHRSDGRFEGQVAVKLLNLAFVGHPSEQRFAREGSVLARLQHPNIARLLDAGVEARSTAVPRPRIRARRAHRRVLQPARPEHRAAHPARSSTFSPPSRTPTAIWSCIAISSLRTSS